MIYMNIYFIYFGLHFVTRMNFSALVPKKNATAAIFGSYVKVRPSLQKIVSIKLIGIAINSISHDKSNNTTYPMINLITQQVNHHVSFYADDVIMFLPSSSQDKVEQFIEQIEIDKGCFQLTNRSEQAWRADDFTHYRVLHFIIRSSTVTF